MSSTDVIFPRIHHSQIDKISGTQNVTIVGMLREGGRLDLLENKFLQVRDNVPTDLIDRAVEFRGAISTGKVFVSNGHVDFGKDFDLDLYYQTIKVLNETENLFGI